MKLNVFVLSTLWALAPSSSASATPLYKVTMPMQAFGNAIGGSMNPRCDITSESETGKQTEWWITFGEVKPNSQGGWEGVSNAVQCGSDAFEKSSAGSGSATRIPYLITNVSTVTAVSADRLGPEKLLQLEIVLSLRKLSGFSALGEPSYEQLTERRSFFLTDRKTIFLPLIVTNEAEKEVFKLHEVMLRIRVELREKKEGAAYGGISVSSELDGATLLLDGGMVGRIANGKEMVLPNVLVGDHEIAVRDPSDRMVHRVVRVEERRTVLVTLNLPAQEKSTASHRLVALGQNAQGYEEYRREMDGAVVVKIPEGKFLMGNKETERNPLEHQVEVSKFLMDKTAVTWGQFKRFAGATGISLPPDPPYWGIHDDHPATFVTWEEAKAYCEWTGGRLLTEAEREKAARGTDGRMYPWGNEEPTPERAVYRRNWGSEATDPVGIHPSGASPYGLLDMGGNVWEWCADWYDDKYYEVSPVRDPKGPSTGRAHVVRGGSWDSRPAVLSASCRNWGHRGYREGDFGFRCAMDPAE